MLSEIKDLQAVGVRVCQFSGSGFGVLAAVLSL